jgi:hypothetical protein
MLGIELRASYMVSTHSATELYLCPIAVVLCRNDRLQKNMCGVHKVCRVKHNIHVHICSEILGGCSSS